MATIDQLVDAVATARWDHDGSPFFSYEWDERDELYVIQFDGIGGSVLGAAAIGSMRNTEAEAMGIDEEQLAAVLSSATNLALSPAWPGLVLAACAGASLIERWRRRDQPLSSDEVRDILQACGCLDEGKLVEVVRRYLIERDVAVARAKAGRSDT